MDDAGHLLPSWRRVRAWDRGAGGKVPGRRTPGAIPSRSRRIGHGDGVLQLAFTLARTATSLACIKEGGRIVTTHRWLLSDVRHNDGVHSLTNIMHDTTLTALIRLTGEVCR